MNTNTAPLQAFSDLLLPAVLQALWILLCSPIGWMLLAMLALHVLVTIYLRIKREIDRVSHMS